MRKKVRLKVDAFRSFLLYVVESIDRKKKMHNLKVENYVLFSRHTEDLSPGDRLSDNCEGLF